MTTTQIICILTGIISFLLVACIVLFIKYRKLQIDHIDLKGEHYLIKQVNSIVQQAKENQEKEIDAIKTCPTEYKLHKVDNSIIVSAYHEGYLSVVKTYRDIDDNELEYVQMCANELIEKLEEKP